MNKSVDDEKTLIVRSVSLLSFSTHKGNRRSQRKLDEFFHSCTSRGGSS
jgi:hypothetical protein